MIINIESTHKDAELVEGDIVVEDISSVSIHEIWDHNWFTGSRTKLSNCQLIVSLKSGRSLQFKYNAREQCIKKRDRVVEAMKGVLDE